MSGYVAAVDQGTTSTRTIIFDDELRVRGLAQQEIAQHFPHPGWVEHDPAELWRSAVETLRLALADAGLSAADIAAIGIANQRETTLVWDRGSGEPIHRAIVWQDRRTAELCARLKADGHEPTVAAKTGLVIDPYFSGTKLAWLLDNVPGARRRAEAGELAFGTIDSWLIWNLTGGRRHVTDATNASRTLLYNIHNEDWDSDLLALLGIPPQMLPEVHDCAAEFGVTERASVGAEIPILGVAGDQQAATIGQACFSPGMVKSTYGTGCFAVLNVGPKPVASQHRLLTTVAYRLDGVATYALEGAIFIAGAAVQWLRDGLGILDRADQSGPMAADADPKQRVYMVPAFTGLGAPHWDPGARGAIFGLTRGTGRRELVRAALDSVCLQTADLVEAMQADWSGGGDMVLRVDGGMVASDWTMQRLADVLAAPVDRPVVLETTALGAAWLAGHKAGVWPDRQRFAHQWRRDRRFEPAMAEAERRALLAGWRDCVETLSR